MGGLAATTQQGVAEAGNMVGDENELGQQHEG